MIAVEHLTKEFGRTSAVRDVSFHAVGGEVVGLLGPNGSGKTTIMRTLTGFFPPTTGRVWVAGIDVLIESLAARQVLGYLPESAVLYPDMRVRQFLDFCADVRGLRGTRRGARLEAVVRDCGLAEVGGRLIGHLSKGYRQRVGLAQALLHEPAVLVLDEPTAGLDPGQIMEIRGLIRALRGRTTVLLSTHILSEAATVCDRVIIISRGRVVAEDTAQALRLRLQEDERIVVRVDGPQDDVLAVLQGVPDLDRIEVDVSEGEPRFIAHTRAGDSACAAISAAVVGRGWGLIEIHTLSMTLEDLFLRLVAGDAGASGS
jgi:ABC-2 type transport system ATP-binding protein